MLNSMAKQTQDLDLVQKAKQSGVHFIDYSGHSGVTSQSPIDFDLKKANIINMFEAGYILTREFLEKQGVKYTENKNPTPSLPCASPMCQNSRHNCTWLREMKIKAREMDEQERQYKTKLSWSKFTFGLDPYIFAQVSIQSDAGAM